MSVWKTEGMNPDVAKVLGRCRSMARGHGAAPKAGSVRRGATREERLNWLVGRAQARHERLRASGAGEKDYHRALDRSIALKHLADTEEAGKASSYRHESASLRERLGKLKADIHDGRKRLETAREERGTAKRKRNARRLREGREHRREAERLRREAAIDPASHTSHKPGWLGHLNTDLIHFDPERFQYKVHQTDTKTGAVGSLAGVKQWNEDASGVLQVWKDPADGKVYVVNGHNRLDLANKLAQKKVGVRFVQAEKPKHARAVGAFTNISEGRGTVVDAAKFFRDSGITKDDLAQRGIPLTEAKATHGMAVASLNNPLFRQVVDETLPVERAAVIGGGGLSHEQQGKLAGLLERRSKRGEVTNNQLKELVEEVKAAPVVEDKEGGLFGADPEGESLALHRADLISKVKERLGREKRLFGTVARKRAASELQKGGNTIDAEASGRISRDAAEALQVFDALKRSVGPISAGINEAARQLHGAKGQKAKKAVHDQLYETVLGQVKQAYGF